MTNGTYEFSFYKGHDDMLLRNDGEPFDWDMAAMTVRQHLNDAMNARHVAFLLGSGCSSLVLDGDEVGIPTMAPLARTFTNEIGEDENSLYLTQERRTGLEEKLGLDLSDREFNNNLERLMEVLYSFRFALERSNNRELQSALSDVKAAIQKIIKYILDCCTNGPFSKGNNTIQKIYEAFYRKLIYRDRALPRPWIFTTNYDLFNEIAMDRLGIPYSNGFTGTIERRFNPATFRYALAEQLDILSRKWTAVDSFIYLCKLHGSINWIENEHSLFPIREVQETPTYTGQQILIYPTPTKHSASFASPYSDLFREFQQRIAREQSVLFVLGYAFGDEHVNNIIFQALTIPTFRLIVFARPSTDGVIARLRNLDDPRIWIIGGDGPTAGRKAHYFDTVVEKFMPEPPGDRIDAAVAQVLQELVTHASKKTNDGAANDL